MLPVPMVFYDMVFQKSIEFDAIASGLRAFEDVD